MKGICNCIYGQAGECPAATGYKEQWNTECDCPSWWNPIAQPKNGDVYLNPLFGDLWIVDGKTFVKINDGYIIDLDEPDGFIKVGHIYGVGSSSIKGGD